MTIAPKMIAVVQGGPSTMVQGLFRTLVDQWRHSARVVGVIAEDHDLTDRACSAGYLRSIRTGERFPIFQDLGPGSTACHLDGSGMLTAAAAVGRDIKAGCDLVILSKFGNLEAGNTGLLDAFVAAMDAGVPLLTSISPRLEAAWARFADPLFGYLPADAVEIDAWWQTVRLSVHVMDGRLPSLASGGSE